MSDCDRTDQPRPVVERAEVPKPDLPVLKPREPAAQCGACGRLLYPGDQVCPSPFPKHREVCPLLGAEWSQMERQRQQPVAHFAGRPSDQYPPHEPQGPTPSPGTSADYDPRSFRVHGRNWGK